MAVYKLYMTYMAAAAAAAALQAAAPTAAPSCDGAALPFTAVGYSPTATGTGAGPNATILYYPSISYTAGLSIGDDFGDQANVTVPCLRFGKCDQRCPEYVPPKPGAAKRCGGTGIANGTEELARLYPGRVSVKLGGLSRDHERLDWLPLRNASRCAAFCNGSNPLGKLQHRSSVPCLFRVWWDNSMAALKAQATKFFAAYKAAGGQLDEIMQDSEQGLTTYNLFDWFGDPSNATVAECLAERWDTLAADPRWPPLLAELRRRGFETDPTVGGADDYLSRAMRFSLDQGSLYARNRMVFNRLMGERGAQYWNDALFAPARRAFPHLRYSDWVTPSSPMYEYDPALCLPTGESKFHIARQFCLLRLSCVWSCLC